MYIRWERRRLRRTQGWTLRAWVAQTQRVNGQPRQTLLCYLASLREAFWHVPAHRGWFWEQVDRRLAGLRLERRTRRRLEAAVAQRVPRPTSEQVEAHLRKLETAIAATLSELQS